VRARTEVRAVEVMVPAGGTKQTFRRQTGVFDLDLSWRVQRPERIPTMGGRGW